MVLWLAVMWPATTLLVPGPALAQASAAPFPSDRSTPLPARQPDQARLRELAAQREFRYEEAEESSGFWDALWARLWRWLNRLRETPTGRVTTNYLLYALVVVTLVFAVLKLLQVDLSAALGRGPRRAGLAYDTEGENIHEVDFRSRIAEAEEAGNFRLATRLGYLQLLKLLTDQGLIRWQPDKTNHTYLTELRAGSLREAFREATRQFEYVWYGELRLSLGLYQQVRADQHQVAAQLTGQRAATLSQPAT
ncbi:hypothetical protein GCM10023185_43490 [Hymenobacter saemangeumensis]|uniref:Protein-glutamine gamma-glutamyltransferase-like C-terminal domain-containing protein n=1 Tax=Hymenobacter saemangeumensis TaxID=1084522 RepID=A0ABP8IRZ1_9BACT